jgi:hypothetical protein
MGSTTQTAPNPTQLLAEDFTALLKADQFLEAINRYYAQDVVNLEPMPLEMPNARVEGLANVRAYNEEWMAAREIHRCEIEGPFIQPGRFALRMHLDVTELATNQRMTMTELALYSVQDGRITQAEYLYGDCQLV